jgi:excisionase family DNA binding protein
MAVEVCEARVGELLDVKEVAELLGISPRHVERLTDAGQMPASTKLGRCRRWGRKQIIRWLEAGCPRCGRGAAAKGGAA